MKSTLWKLTALAGVMGAGFLVVYQAQQDMTRSGLVEDGTADGETVLSEEPLDGEFQPLADLVSKATEAANARDAADAEPPQQDEPEPTLAQRNPDRTEVDPFSGRPHPEEGQASPSDSVTAEDNPFSGLLRSLAETPEVDEPQGLEPQEGLASPAGYASIPDRSSPPTVEADTLNPFPTGLADTSLPGQTEGSPELPASAEVSDERQSLEMPPQGEPSTLMALNRSDSPPELIPPPVDVTPADDSAESHSPSQEQGVDSAIDETMLPDDEIEDVIAQVGGERAAPRVENQNPFLMLPDNGPQTQSRAAREPNPFDGSAATPAATANVILPDGSVEMPIHSRDDSVDRLSSENQLPSREPTEGFDPFGDSASTTPPQQAQPKSIGAQPGNPPIDRQVQPAAGGLLPRFEDEPELEATPPQGLPVMQDNPLPLTHSLPLGNTPALAPENTPPRPNQYEGMGTVSPDSPTGTQQAQLTIEKVAPADAVLGKPLVYEIKIRNIGQSPAENVVVKDMTPKGSRLEGSIPQGELDEVEQKLMWRLGVMAPGEQRVIRVKVVPTEARQIGSVATVTFEAAVAATTNITAPELRLTVQGQTEVRVGEKASYTFTLTNAGSADASGVFIRNLIPEGFQHPRGNDLEYDVGILAKGQSKDITLTLLAVAPGQFDNRAILGAEGDIEIEAQKSVSILTSRLKVHRQGPANRFVGRPALFTNTIINESSEPVQGITVQETVPEGVEFVDASEGGRFNPQDRTITWQLPGLLPGEKRQLQSQVKPVTPGEKSTLVKAFDSRQDTAEATSQLIVAGFSSLTIDVAHAGRPVPVGEEVALRLTIRNRGTAPANDVRALVEIPAEMKFVDAKGPVRHRMLGNQQIEFEALNTLEVDAEEQFDIVLSAAQQGKDARVKVQLTAAELTTPLQEDEQVVIYSERE